MEFTPLPSEMPESPGSDVSDEASESTPEISAGDSSTAEPERLNLNNEGAVDSLFTRLAADSSFVAVDTDNNSSVDAVQWDVDGDGTDDALVTKTDDGYVISDPSGMLAPHAVSRDQLMGLAPGSLLHWTEDRLQKAHRRKPAERLIRCRKTADGESRKAS